MNLPPHHRRIAPFVRILAGLVGLVGLVGPTPASEDSSTAREMTLVVTAYCPCAICCGPGSPKPTASGAWPREGRTVAAPRRFPFGTVLLLEGVGVRRVEDRLSPRYQDRLDLFFDDHQRARQWGRRTLRVTVLSPLRPR